MTPITPRQILLRHAKPQEKPYPLYGMESSPTGRSAQDDRVLGQRKIIAKYTLLANRIGYLLWAVSVSTFVMAFVMGFSGPIVSVITVTLVIGGVLLAPSIILGYAIKAAIREDKEMGRL